MTAKWDILRSRVKKRPIKEEAVPLCRVLPPRLARTPGILEYLNRNVLIRPTMRVAMELKLRYREIAELLKHNNFDC